MTEPLEKDYYLGYMEEAVMTDRRKKKTDRRYPKGRATVRDAGPDSPIYHEPAIIHSPASLREALKAALEARKTKESSPDAPLLEDKPSRG